MGQGSRSAAAKAAGGAGSSKDAQSMLDKIFHKGGYLEKKGRKGGVKVPKMSSAQISGIRGIAGRKSNSKARTTAQAFLKSYDKQYPKPVKAKKAKKKAAPKKSTPKKRTPKKRTPKKK